MGLTGGGKNNFNNANDYAMIGLAHFGLNDFSESEKHLLLAEKLFRINQNGDNLSEVLDNLCKLYEAKKDFKKSVQYRAAFTLLKDSLDESRSRALIVEYETKYLSIEKDRQNELLIAKNSLLQSEAKQNTLLVISLTVVIAIGLALAYNLRIVKHSKNRLEHQNEIIAKQNKEVANKNLHLANLIEENQTLMGVLAHDLRAPFSKIIGLVNLLEDKEYQNEKSVFTGYINDICKGALQLILDTINISQIYNENSDELKQKMEVFNPSQLIENALNSFQAVATEKQITISFANATPDTEIYSSKEYLTRIFDNLISNAIKFSPVNTNITLTTLKMTGNLIISVKDEGLGFTEADKKQLFTRFKKLSARPTGNEVSSGLGLFIVKQLVDLIGAKIHLKSVKGEGSEFILELPLNSN
jgi:signal transduction histidine kinase